MTLYLLDTNIVSYLIDTASPHHEAARAGLSRLGDADEVGLPVLSLYELHRWIAFRPEMAAAASQALTDFRLLPLPPAAAGRFGGLMRDLRQDLPRRDIQRIAVDCMIAVTAVENDAILVSHDGLFERLQDHLPELRVVDWKG